MKNHPGNNECWRYCLNEVGDSLMTSALHDILFYVCVCMCVCMCVCVCVGVGVGVLGGAMLIAHYLSKLVLYWLWEGVARHMKA